MKKKRTNLNPFAFKPSIRTSALCSLAAFCVLSGLFYCGCQKTTNTQTDKSVNQPKDGSQTRSDAPISSEPDADSVSDDSPSILPSKENALATEPIAGVKTLENLLLTAKQPIGHTMYIWGGGWNEEDTGAGIEAVSIGISSRWRDFESQQTSAYDYNNTRYQIHDGLDCSGYIGWLVYNVFHDTDGADGYVQKAGTMAETFASYGWGSYTPAEEVTNWMPGDIMSMDGHVWLSLGMCEDGSVLLAHASPPGVRICGVRNSDGSNSKAVELATQYMKEFYPEWYERFPECGVDSFYLTKSSQMRWYREVLNDSEQLSEADARYIMERLYRTDANQKTE